jgi:hypothetical protein
LGFPPEGEAFIGLHAHQAATIVIAMIAMLAAVLFPVFTESARKRSPRFLPVQDADEQLRAGTNYTNTPNYHFGK